MKREPSFLPSTILVHVGLDLLGDGLLKLPFLRAVREIWPNARVTWLCGQGGSLYRSALAPTVVGLIDELIEMEPPGWGRRWHEMLSPLPVPLRGRSFDLILDSQRGPLASLLLRRVPHQRLVTPAARGWLSDCRPPSGTRRSPDMLRQMLDLLELAAGQPVPTPLENRVGVPVEAQAAARSLVARLTTGRPAVGLAPGAGGRHKCWPLAAYCALGKMIVEAGACPLFLLGPAESDWQEEIARCLPEAVFPLQDEAVRALAVQEGMTGPLATVAVCQALAVTVCNDAGVGHLAAASGAPVVLLYGPTSPRKFAPLSSRRSLICAQSFSQAGAKTGAMADIPVEAVAQDVFRWLAMAGPLYE